MTILNVTSLFRSSVFVAGESVASDDDDDDDDDAEYVDDDDDKR